MCNLYRLTSNVEAMRRLFAVDPASAPNLAIFNEVYPDRDAPVIRSTLAGTREFALMCWGFPPPVVASRPVTNVRNLASPFWRTALSRPDRRCLVPVTAFCEWTAEPDPATRRKRKVWFDVPEQPVFAFVVVASYPPAPRTPYLGVRETATAQPSLLLAIQVAALAVQLGLPLNEGRATAGSCRHRPSTLP